VQVFGDEKEPRPGIKNDLKPRPGFGDGPVVAMNPPKEEWKYFEPDYDLDRKEEETKEEEEGAKKEEDKNEEGAKKEGDAKNEEGATNEENKNEEGAKKEDASKK
jgi:hypothetical protein